jgi:hypothetical protein
MNGNHKLYHYEISPPDEAWKRIAQELEDLNEYKKISQKLQNLQVAAPVSVWEKINEELSERQSFSAIAKKLSDIEMTPPADMWRKIEMSLSTPQSAIKKQTSVISIFTKYVALAAAVLGIIVIAGYFWMQHSSQNKNQIASTFINKDSTLISGNNSEKAATANEIKSPSNTEQKNQTNNHQLAATQTAIVTTSKGNAYTTTIEKNKEINGRYIVMMTKEGNVVRMNKKVSNMADCIAGDDNSSDCDNKITEWQKELASMPVLATPDNILNLLELANKEPVATKL